MVGEFLGWEAPHWGRLGVKEKGDQAARTLVVGQEVALGPLGGDEGNQMDVGVTVCHKGQIDPVVGESPLP